MELENKDSSRFSFFIPGSNLNRNLMISKKEKEGEKKRTDSRQSYLQNRDRTKYMRKEIGRR